MVTFVIGSDQKIAGHDNSVFNSHIFTTEGWRTIDQSEEKAVIMVNVIIRNFLFGIGVRH